MKLIFMFLITVVSFSANAAEISCEGKDDSGRKATFVVKFGSFPNEPQALITKIKGKTKRYPIHLCEITHEGSASVDCQQLPPEIPDLSKIAMVVVHEYGLPSDTDELGLMVSGVGGRIQGAFFEESWDDTIFIDACRVTR
jgi:hypothetical protein